MTVAQATRKISAAQSGDRFVATYDSDATSFFEKSRQLADIGSATDLFVAPRPILISQTREQIEWQFLEGLVPIRNRLPLLAAQQQLDIASQIGSSLAAIHDGLNLHGDLFSTSFIIDSIQGESLRQRIADAIESAPALNVHGDFACANLFLDANDKIVTLDPEPNIYLFDRSSPSIRAPIYVEIALLIQSFSSRHDFTRSLTGRLDSICEAILCGYEKQATIQLDRAAVYGLAAEIMLIYRNYRLHDGTETWFARAVAGRFRMHAAKRLREMAKEQMA